MNESYDVAWCDHCSYGYVLQRPTKEQALSYSDLDHFYTHGAQPTSANLAGETSFLDRLRVHLSWRLDRSEPLSPEELLPFVGDRPYSMVDFGCGDGENMMRFSSRTSLIVGIEPDPKAIAVATRNGLVIFEGTAEEPPRRHWGRSTTSRS